MKKVYFIFIVPISISVCMFAQECPPPRPNQRDLVILPDTAGEESIKLLGYNAVGNFQTYHLEKLLYSQAAPFLVELSIWKRFAQKVKIFPKPWLEQINYDFYTFANYLLCIPTKWKSQFSDTGFNLTKFTRVPSPFTLFPKFLDPIKGTFKSLLALIHVYSSLVKLLHTLLVKPSNSFAWNVVLFGHGGPGLTGSYSSRIAGIPFDEFKKLLQFLENKIKTNLFLYSTCYAGSKWLLKAYETKGKVDIYHFPIIITGISEAPVYTWPSLHEAARYGSLFQKIKTTPLCEKDMNQLGLIAGILLQAIEPTKDSNQYVIRSTNNLLQVRWPNATKFQPFELTNLVKSAQTLKRESKKIDAVPVMTTALVIDTPFLNRGLVLSRPDHTITSNIPNKWHYIKSILLTTQKEEPEQFMHRLLGYFSSTISLLSPKVFLIDQVSHKHSPTRADNVMVFIHAPSPSSFLPKNEIFYIIGDQGYRIVQGTTQAAQLSQKMTTRYLKLFEEQKKKLQEEHETRKREYRALGQKQGS